MKKSRKKNIKSDNKNINKNVSQNINQSSSVKFEGSFRDTISFESRSFYHLLVAVLLIKVIPYLIFFMLGRDPFWASVLTFAAFMVTGLVIGYWAKCIPVITYALVMFIVSGDTILDLLMEKTLDYWSTEFNMAIVSLFLLYSLLVIFTYIGVRLRKAGLDKFVRK